MDKRRQTHTARVIDLLREAGIRCAVGSSGCRENVEFVLEASITALEGENELCGIVVNSKGEQRRIPVQGLFVAIGHAPDNGLFSELIELDGAGYAASGEDCLTRSAGVFVAGDCRRKSVHQLTTAVADGSVAALAACSWLDSL